VEGYTLHDVLGSGAHAEVHRAEAVGRPGRIVAVKRFTAAATPTTVREVRREAEALERLSHPSIVRLLDVATDGDGVALVTPYVPGGTLASRIARGPLPAAAVADLGARLGDALAAAHAAGIVHRDVKPTNVLFDAEEQPLLTDFGAAVLAGEDVTETVGTATYLDPEVVAGAAAPGPASDQYALGVVLYESLAGSPPYAAPTVEATLRAADRGVPAPLGQLVPDAPPTIVTAIERAIRRDPTERFPTVRELASHLEEARSGLGTEVAGGPDVTPVPLPGAPPAAAAGSAPGSAPPLPTHRAAEPPSTSPRRGRTAPASDAPTRTRRFGPAPPRPAPEPPPERRRVPLLFAAIAAVLVPIGIVLAFVLGDGGDPVITADAPTGATGPHVTDPDATPPPELPACDDAPALPPGNGELVPADTTGSGCTVELGWDPDTQVLAVPEGDDEVMRYQLGEAGDVLLLGDWDCDGPQTPGLYRPSSGEVFLFDGFAGPGGVLDSGPAQPTGAIGGDPVVVTDDDGCDRIEVPEGA
jgi:eukaryotic-like serine/threonine-protein kinase